MAAAPLDAASHTVNAPALREAATRFFGADTVAEPVGAVPHLLRVTASGQDYVVRQWPEGAAAAQANLSAQVLAAAGDAGGGRLPAPVPATGDGQGFTVSAGGRLHTASTWLEGRPLARYGGYRTPDGGAIDVPLPPSYPATDLIVEAVRLIARTHVASVAVAEAGRATATPARVLDKASRAWNQQRRTVGDRAASAQEIRRWLRCGNRVLPVATEQVPPAGSDDARAVVVHGDLWPANLLIAGEGEARILTGVVGWSSVAIGSPLIDLSHLVIHTAGWSGALAEAVLGAYTEEAPLSPAERRLLPVVAALDLLTRVGRLLHLAYVDDRMIGHEGLPVLRSGLKSLLVSLESLTNLLVPEPTWDQRKASEARRRRTGSPRTPRPTRTTPGPRSGSGRSRPGSRPGTPRKG